jgi:hypothetical protein
MSATAEVIADVEATDVQADESSEVTVLTHACHKCDVKHPVDADHWHRCKPDSRSGKDIDRELGFYVTGLCKPCAAAARAGLDPNREVVRRGANKAERVAQAAAEAQAAEVAYIGSPAYVFAGYVPSLVVEAAPEQVALAHSVTDTPPEGVDEPPVEPELPSEPEPVAQAPKAQSRRRRR